MYNKSDGFLFIDQKFDTEGIVFFKEVIMSEYRNKVLWTIEITKNSGKSSFDQSWNLV